MLYGTSLDSNLYEFSLISIYQIQQVGKISLKWKKDSESTSRFTIYSLLAIIAEDGIPIKIMSSVVSNIVEVTINKNIIVNIVHIADWIA